MNDARREATEAQATAERLAELADVAELMDDPDGAARLRRDAARVGDHAMRLLDD